MDPRKKTLQFFFSPLLKKFFQDMGREPNNLEMILLRQKAGQQLKDSTKVIEFPQKTSFKEQIDAMRKSGDIVDADDIKISEKITDREMFKNSNLNKPTIEGQMEKITGASNKIKQIQKEQADMYRPKTDAEIKAKFEKQNKEAAERLRNKRMLDEDEIAELDMDIGGLEYTNDFDGTLGSANKLRKERADYIAEMELEYKKGNLDPKPGEANRERFLQQKFDEMEASGDNRLMTRDEVEELSSFSLQKDMDKSVKKFKEKDAKQKKTLKDFDPKDRDPSATGGRAGFYTGGITDVEPSLDDIGHGSDALMARTRLMSPGAQATTSTGLNYLLAEDNDNMRIPFAKGGGFLKSLFSGVKPDGGITNSILKNKYHPILSSLNTMELYDLLNMLPFEEGGRVGFAKGKLAKEVLDKGRRGFMKAAGATGAGIAALKTGLLGFGKEAAPVVEKAVEAAKGVPPYFYQLIDVIKSKGQEIKSYGERVKQYITPSKDGKSELMLTEDLNTGNIQVKKIYKEGDDMVTKTEEMNFNKGQADEATKGTPADNYEEVTSYNSRIYKDEFNDPDFVDGIDVEEIVKEIDVKKADGGRIGMLAGGGILKAVLKNSADAKGMTVRDFIMAMNPKSIPSNIKNLISKVDLEQLKAGYKDYYENISDMMKTRFDFQKGIEGGKTTPAKEMFEDLERTMDKQSYVPKTVTQDDIAKTELMIKNKFNKGRKDNAQGGLQTMLGE